LSTEIRPYTRERADRLRNRAVIVRAAREAFARADEAGETLSMNEVARAANVGIATLYRHFPSRDELANAVYHAKIDELTEDLRESALGRDAITALKVWVSEFALFMLATRGMMDTLRAAWQSSTASSSPTVEKISGIVGGFLAAGANDGTVRDDIDPTDVTIAILALLSATPRGDSGARSIRLLALFTDSLSNAPTRSAPPRQ
jgi:AcrR family transcriptional regulator